MTDARKWLDREPTEKMIVAGDEVWISPDVIATIWRAMYDAAPDDQTHDSDTALCANLHKSCGRFCWSDREKAAARLAELSAENAGLRSKLRADVTQARATGEALSQRKRAEAAEAKVAELSEELRTQAEDAIHTKRNLSWYQSAVEDSERRRLSAEAKLARARKLLTDAANIWVEEASSTGAAIRAFLAEK